MGRNMWQFTGKQRPPFAHEPSEGQESVWDYPRPPAVVPDRRHVVVQQGNIVLAESRSTVRVLETASPPTFYIPPSDVQLQFFSSQRGSSFCEWKGQATYWSLQLDTKRWPSVGWSYEHPSSAFEMIGGFLSFYPGQLECYVEGERVRSQPGGFYGGWVTDEVVGPYKGEPGTGGW